MRLNQRVAIISGASQGLGLEVAKQFIAEGANIVLCSRNPEALQAAQKELLALANGNQILAKPTDVSNYSEVESLVQLTIDHFKRIDILVANAGIYGSKGPVEDLDWEEWAQAIDINLKGTVWQCRAVLPHFKQAKKGKIIILSGGGATKPLPNLSAYAASKAGVVRFAETLAEEVKQYSIDVNTVAPGALNTRLLDEILNSGPERIGEKFYQDSLKQKDTGGTPLSIGGALCTFLASEVSDGITGKLLSAVWDPWKHLPQFKEQLNQSDIYTLRRIVPKDRGLDWDNLLCE